MCGKASFKVGLRDGKREGWEKGRGLRREEGDVLKERQMEKREKRKKEGGGGGRVCLMCIWQNP